MLRVGNITESQGDFPRRKPQSQDLIYVVAGQFQRAGEASRVWAQRQGRAHQGSRSEGCCQEAKERPDISKGQSDLIFRSDQVLLTLAWEKIAGHLGGGSRAFGGTGALYQQHTDGGFLLVKSPESLVQTYNSATLQKRERM